MRGQGRVSRTIQPERSLVASTGSGQALSRCYVYQLQLVMVTEFHAVHMHAWVGDLVQRVESTISRRVSGRGDVTVC